MAMLSRSLMLSFLITSWPARAMVHKGHQVAMQLQATKEDWWPSARGRVGRYGESPFSGPANLSDSLAWEWHHPDGRYHTVTLGVVIDSKKNVYLSADDAIRKFTPDGELLWIYKPPASIPTNPSLQDGKLFGSTSNGHIFSLDMESGSEIWIEKVADANGDDTGFVTVADGVVVAATDKDGFAARVVRGLNATDGTGLWDFRPDAAIWNFMAEFVGDGTFVFQDVEGGAYRHNLHDGRRLWKAGGLPGTHTDGTAMLGPNGILYTVSLDACCCGPCRVDHQMGPDTTGFLNAFRLSDGHQLWQQKVARPPNVFPAVGRLHPGADYSVIIPVGQQCGATQNDIYAFDAATGNPQWLWVGPKNRVPWCAGDAEGLVIRSRLHIRNMCAPNPWSGPTIDKDGAIFTGNQNGKFYRIQDANGDNRIEPDEVSTFDTKSSFSSPGSAHAPGMVAIASCDGLFVFKG